MQNQFRIFVFILSISLYIPVFCQTSNQSKLKGNIEISAYPIHKASLLGLTSTEFPTLGTGFAGEYSKWSFYGVTYHEFLPNVITLSQSEVNLSYKLIDKKAFSCTVFNTSVSRAKDSAIFMIPTLAIGLFNTKSFKLELTPYTWGFHSKVQGYTYALSYDYSKLIQNCTFGCFAKGIYTKISPVYTGFMTEISPRIRYKNSIIQSRIIYQLSTNNFVYDLSFKQMISIGKSH